jgi:sugar O-acyltransferase (sialic acid O-acetyltransferase NeuD family)
VKTTLALYVFGAGGHGKVIVEAARQGLTHRILGFLDDDRRRWGCDWDGLPVVGGRDALPALEAGAEVALAVGDNHARAELARTMRARGRRLATVVHPTAVVASGVRLGEGTYVAPLAVLHADARIGRGCIVNTGAVVEHDCTLEDWVHVSPHAALGGAVSLGEGAHVGLGALVLPGLRLGPWATLGAGAVMVDSLPGRVTAIGVPARVRPTAVGAR